MRYIFLVLLLLVACAAPLADNEITVDTDSLKEPVVLEEPVESEEVVSVTEPAVAAAEGDIVEASDNDPYSDLGCDALFSVEEFASICNVEPALIDKTYRFGTKNCMLSVRDINDRTITAGVDATKFDSADAAAKELERRLKVRLAGASDTDIPGARTYEFDMINRHNIEFVKGDSIVTVAASTELCSDDSLMELAKVIARRV